MIDGTSASNLTINATSGDDNITVDDAGTIASDDAIIVQEANSNFESYTFANKEFVTVDGMSGNDSLAWNATRPAAGLAYITLDGGDGNDTFYAGTVPGAILAGGPGDDSYIFDPARIAATDHVVPVTVTENTSEGTDTLDFRAYTDDLTVDLSASGSQLVDADSYLYVTLTNTLEIENLIGGSGNDVLTGNDNNNTITGGDGNDTLIGGDGDDALHGGDGIDLLDGGDGTNTIDPGGTPPQFVGTTTSFTVDEDANPTVVDLFADFQDDNTTDQDLSFDGGMVTDSDLFSAVDIDPSAGTLTVTYAADASGQSDVTVEVIDAEGNATDQTYSFTVNSVNDTPTTSGMADVEVRVGSPDVHILLPAAFNDVEDGGALTFSDTLSGNQGVLNGIAIANDVGLLTLTPSTGTDGSVQITIRATDSGNAYVETSFTFTVDPLDVNHVPVLDAAPSIPNPTNYPNPLEWQNATPFADMYANMYFTDQPPEAQPTSGTLVFTVGAHDDDGDALTFELGENAPSGAELTQSGNVATITWPYTTSDGGATHDFPVRVSDNGNPELYDEHDYYASVSTSYAGNWTPIAHADFYEAGVNEQLSEPAAGVLLNDLDSVSGSPIHVSGYTTPTSGTLTLNSNGSFLFTPHTGFAGLATWTYLVVDSAVHYSNWAMVTVDVKPDINITADTTNDGTINSDDDTYENKAPGAIIKLNDNDDNQNGKQDRYDVPFRDQGGNPTNDPDLAPIKIALPPNINLADFYGYKIQLTASDPKVFKLWETQTKQKEAHEYIIGKDTIPSQIYVEGIGAGQGTVTAVLKDRDGGAVSTNTTTVTSVGLSMVAYRPISPPLVSTAIPRTQNVTPGIGIRRNGDDDNHNGTPDSQDAQVNGEDDLIQVLITMLPVTVPNGVQFVLSRDSTAINVYQHSDKTGVLLGPNTGNEVVLTSGGSFCVEWAAMGTGAATSGLHFKIRTQTSHTLTNNKEPISDPMSFHPFKSDVIVFGGFTATPMDPPPHVGVWWIGKQLYLDGYDVHMYAWDQWQSDAWPEVQSALTKRGVIDLGIFGHSFGGCSTYLLAKLLDDNSATLDYSLRFTAYIDAVAQSLPPQELTLPVPNNAFHLNVFQTNDSPHGGPGCDNERVDETSAGLKHSTIDDDSTVQDLVKARLEGNLDR